MIAFRGSNTTVGKIEEALLLAPLELKLGFTALQWGAAQPSTIHHSGPGASVTSPETILRARTAHLC